MRLLISLIVLFAAIQIAPPTGVVLAQEQLDRSSDHASTSQTSERLKTRPPSSIPVGSDVRVVLRSKTDDEPLTDREILSSIGRIYERQARLLEAVAFEDHGQVETQIAAALEEIQQLLAYPEVVARPRFRELYRTVLMEYERYYGAPADSLSLPNGEIFAFHDDMFEALNEVGEPLLEDVDLPRLTPVATTIPMTQNRLVEQSIAYLLRSPEKHLYNWMSRAETYFPMIEGILEEEGMPDELKYLAMVESALNPRARSWAAANGMWQFISATGRAYGLEVNSWVDERLDPEKSTRAAARHLRDLHQMFGGDWQLALAGYNCSPARIRRALRRAERRLNRKPTFWDIYNDIPRETRNYVPMFIAASLVASNPDAFDVDLSQVEPGPEYEYHYVPIRGFFSLEEIADLAGTTEATIRALNPELRRSHVPPAEDAFYVRIPLGTYEQFAEAYADLPDEKKTSTISYTVKRGDVLGKIAGRYGVSVRDLMRTNGLSSTTIRVGQRLVVPVPSYDNSPVLADADGDNVFTVDYGRSRSRPVLAEGSMTQRRRSRATPVVRTSMSADRGSTARAAGDARPPEDEPATDDAGKEAPAETTDRAEPSAEEADEEPARTRIVYTVRRGDNLTEIAKKYGVSISDLREWNSIRGSRIQTGQKLYLYDANPEKAEVTTTVYRVRRGDTLSEIASRYSVRISDLRRWNDLRTNTIRVGQRLTIQGGQSSTVTHRVQRGDSLYLIARKYGVSISDIKRWNSLRSSTIRPGQTLTIHG